MKNFLRLTFRDDLDGTGDLHAQVDYGGFSGASSAYFDKEALIEFAKRLARSYPLHADAPLKIEGGGTVISGSKVEQVYLGMAFYPIFAIGTVGCRVELCTPLHPDERPESQSVVKVELYTTYQEVGVFAEALEMLVRGYVREAVLLGAQ